MPTPDPDELLSAARAGEVLAARLGRATPYQGQTILMHYRNGKLPGVRVSEKNIVFRRRDVDAFIPAPAEWPKDSAKRRKKKEGAE